MEIINALIRCIFIFSGNAVNLLRVERARIALFLVCVTCPSNPVLFICNPRILPSFEYGICMWLIVIGSVVFIPSGIILNLLVFVLIFQSFS